MFKKVGTVLYILRNIISRNNFDSIFIQVLGTVVIASLGFLTGILTAHYFSVTDRRTYGILFSTASSLLPILGIGLTGSFNILGLSKVPLPFSKSHFRLTWFPTTLIFFSTFFLLQYFNFTLLMAGLVSASSSMSFQLQLYINAVQNETEQIRYLMLRLALPFANILIVLMYILRVIDNMYSFMVIWSCIVISLLAFFLIKVRRRMNRSGQNMINLKEILKRGLYGQLAHLNASDTIIPDNLLLPLLLPYENLAVYFVMAGLGVWPKLIIDGAAIGVFSRYLKFQVSDRLRFGRNLGIVSVILIGSIVFILWLLPGDYFHFLVSEKYLPEIDLFFSFSLINALTHSRRLILDPIRVMGIKESLIASRIEFKAGLIGAVGFISIIFSSSIDSVVSMLILSRFIALLVVLHYSRRMK